MPAPTPSRSGRRPSRSAPSVSVRIATDRQKSPQRWPARGASSQPMAPQYRPRGVLSRPAISSIVWCLGAPVIEPQGNTARSRSAKPISGRSCACTVEVIWNTVE